MQKEKIRVYVLARELNVDTKVLLDMCKQAGYDVKNQLSNLEPEQRERSRPCSRPDRRSQPQVPAAKAVLQTPLPDQAHGSQLGHAARAPCACDRRAAAARGNGPAQAGGTDASHRPGSGSTRGAAPA